MVRISVVVALVLILPSLLGCALTVPVITTSPVTFAAYGADGFPDIADVTSITSDGPYHPGQTVDVRVNFTMPVSLEAFTMQDGGRDAAGGTFTKMDRPSGLATVQIGGLYYALVSTVYDDGVQIIDITDPASPVAVAAIADGTNYPNLAGGYTITTVQMGNLYYALVASQVDNGIQIINITDPASPSPVAALNDGATYTELQGAYSITTTQIGDAYYALVAGRSDDGIQIIDITDPASPSPVTALHRSQAYPALRLPTSVTTVQIGDLHYALTTSKRINAVQIIDITDPARPSPVAVLTDSRAYPELKGAYSITTTQIGDSYYALVAAYNDNGVQIINITDPARPSPVAALTDSRAYPELKGAASITTTQIGSSHYALVASIYDDGVQIINITDPARPSPVAALTDGQTYPELEGARTVITTQVGDSHYALVAGVADNGVQMIDITDPVHPFNPLMPYMRMDLDGDRRATYIGQAHDNHALVFEYVVKDGDQTGDLAYSGTDALVLGHSGLTDTGDFSDLSNVTLPEPGASHSLNHNKQIDLRAWPDNLPTVDAGQDLTVNEGDAVILSGTASNQDGDQLTYLWSHDSALDISLANATALSTTFIAPTVDLDTTVTFVLSVSDGTDADVTDQVTITVQDVPTNSPPTVDAGQDLTVNEGDAITLNGTASDADGDTLTYLWSHDSDSEITLDNPSSPSVSLTVPQMASNATVTFMMTVTDQHNATGSDAVAITILDVSADDPPDSIANQPQNNTVVWDLSEQRGPRDISRIILNSAVPGTIQAAWEASGETPANYRISWAKTGESYLTWTDLTGNAFPTDPSQTITGLEEGETYKVKVRASYAGTAGDWSGDVTITIAETATNMTAVPGAPFNLGVLSDDSGTLDVSWQAPVFDGSLTVTGYTVQWKTISGDWTVPSDVSEAATTGTNHTITGLDDGTLYAVRVFATNSIGDGVPSVESIVTQQAPQQLRDSRDIGRILLSSAAPGTIQAAWEASGETPANYRISWAKTGESYLTWTDLTGNAFPTDPSQTITGLEEGETYKVKVRASYAGTAGDWSGDITITIAGS